VVYSGILGTVGALVPFTTRDDVDFFTHLEMCALLPAPPSLPWAACRVTSRLTRSSGTCDKRRTALSAAIISCTDPTTCPSRTSSTATCILPPHPLPAIFFASSNVFRVLTLCRRSCECFNILEPAKQKQIADELERTVGEVAKKLEDMRNRLM
jgi:hypothetical protein